MHDHNCIDANALCKYIFNRGVITDFNSVGDIDFPYNSFNAIQSTVQQHLTTVVEIVNISGNVGNTANFFNLSNLPAIRSLEIGCFCFQNCEEFTIEDLPKLEAIIIHNECFNHSFGNRLGCWTLRKCCNLRLIQIDSSSFEYYSNVCIADLPSLMKIQLGNHVFTQSRECFIRSRLIDNHIKTDDDDNENNL